MLAIFYTGDVRHNQDIRIQNHQELFDRIGQLIPYKVYSFTRNDPGRGQCPYDPPPTQADPDNVYRRGQGGAVQVWDFMRGVERTQEPYILRLRTDIWFNKSSIDAVVKEIELMLENKSDIAYFGSDWVNQTAGVDYQRLPVNIDHDPVVQDFVILAKRNQLKTFDSVIDDLNKLNPNKRRSGNKTFRYIVPTDQLYPGMRNQLAIVHRILCRMWLIRQDYTSYPEDVIVCRDYIQSYIADDKAKMGKKNLAVPHPMQDAVNWWRAQNGWAPKEIEVRSWWAWQLQ